MIKIKRFPSGPFLEFMVRDILKRKSEDLAPENMLDGKLGYMWLIFGTCLRNRNIQWYNNRYERNRVVTMTLDKVKVARSAFNRRSRFIKGKDIEEQIEHYHRLLDAEAKRRGGVVVDVKNYH